MQKMEEYAQTGNINAKWLDNVYDNIKRLEEHERLAREGCESLLVYLSIPQSTRHIVMGDAKFKNLRFFVTEFHLLLSDLGPIIDDNKIKEYKTALNKLDTVLSKKNHFIKEIFDTSRKITDIKTTEFFHETILFLSDLKVKLFKEIKHILYIPTSNPM